MIGSREELKFYLAADRYALGMQKGKPGNKDEVWRFQILLRMVEYYRGTSGGLGNRILLKYYGHKKHRLGLILGLDIPSDVFGAGLRINHSGNIVVNGKARVGMWCDIHQGVNIGTNASSGHISLVPVIGNNVWIGPGAKIFGDIRLGSGCVVGANAVVGKSFSSDCTVAGVPARIIKDTGTKGLDVAANPSRMNTFFREFPAYSAYKPTETLQEKELQ